MEISMKLIIESSQNGYILTGKFNDNDLISKVVIEEKDGEDSELEAMQDLLYAIKEYFGVYYSKHNEKNLVVEIEKTR
jgi:hypothetical protein